MDSPKNPARLRKDAEEAIAMGVNFLICSRSPIKNPPFPMTKIDGVPGSVKNKLIQHTYAANPNDVLAYCAALEQKANA